MADNTVEEHLDNPPKTPSDTSDDIIPIIDTETIIPNQEAENMEVHHHSHSHGKKTWKSYFWEFLMLFLAVFCGFLAEYKLEHTLEHQRAKEFAKSLVLDLQNDTTAINFQRKRGGIYVANTDSLLRLGNTSLEGRNATQFSFYTRFLYWTAPLSWNRTTFEQVKNSGSLRYFTNFQLLNKLMRYEAQVNAIEGEFSNHQTRGNMLLTLINEIIDPQLHHDLSKYQLLELDTMTKETKEAYFNVPTVSLENKRLELKELLNMSIVQQRNLRFNDTRLQEAKNLATELISEFKKEYDFE
ncbi:MAG: hypothetical protein ABIO79_05765 [Ferruginibacter sp.]